MTGLHLAPQPLFLHFRILFPDLCAQGHGRHSSQFVEICIGCTCTSPSFFLLVIGTLALKNISFNLFPRQQFKKRWWRFPSIDSISSLLLLLQLLTKSTSTSRSRNFFVQTNLELRKDCQNYLVWGLGTSFLMDFKIKRSRLCVWCLVENCWVSLTLKKRIKFANLFLIW